MYEELERRPVLNEDELSEVKYSWQRVRSTVRDVRSGIAILPNNDRGIRLCNPPNHGCKAILAGG